MTILRRWPKSYDATSRLNFGFFWKQRVNYFIWRELQSYIITQIDLSPALFFFETDQCTYFIYYQWWYKWKKYGKELWLCKLNGLSWTNHSIKETDFILFFYLFIFYWQKKIITNTCCFNYEKIYIYIYIWQKTNWICKGKKTNKQTN